MREVQADGEPAERRQQIGPIVREMRLRRDWSLAELAQRAGISPSYLSRLERGASVPSYRKLLRLADAFGVEITFFTSVEQTAKELAVELSDYLASLGMPRATWPEFVGLSLEARGALVDALRRLTGPHARAIPRQRALQISILSRGVAESIPLILAGISEFGLSPVDFGRSRAQIEELPGDRLSIADRLSTVPGAERFDQLQVFRLLYGVDPPDPMLLKWWTRILSSSLTETLREHEARNIYPAASVERYLRTGYWGPRFPIAPDAVRQHVQATIDLLRENPRYRIGLIDTTPPVGFLAKGTSGIVVYAMRPSEATDIERPRVALHLSGSVITAQFRSYFEELWESIPPERKDSEAIAAWLEAGLALIGQSR